MMEQKRTGRIACILELIVETVCFLCISYLLGCATYSFWNHPLFILFFSVNCWLLSHYWEALRRHLSKGKAAILFALALAAYFGLLCWGILPLSTVPVTW